VKEMGRMRLLAKMVLHAFRRCIAWQDAFLRCAENFIFMASAEGVGICALSAIIQLHTSAKGVKWNGVVCGGKRRSFWSAVNALERRTFKALQ